MNPMNVFEWLQLALYFTILLLLVVPLGAYMARVYQNEKTFLDPLLAPVEQLFYRVCGINPQQEMNWKTYALAMLVFNALGFLMLYGLQRVQQVLPLNPQMLDAVAPDSAFNTAVSFASNTNWQAYSGETTMSYLTQMLGMTVQNFVSAATGMAILVAFIRGLVRTPTQPSPLLRERAAEGVGNFWQDLTRSILYILLPLSIVFALVLVSQGVVQTWRPNVNAELLQATIDANGARVVTQDIAVGSAASQIAIKQLGTNGGGFFNVNSAHPFENPTPLTNFLQLLAILLLPASLCYTFGKMVGDTRQGWALLLAMLIIFVAFVGVAVWSETQVNPNIAALGVNVDAGNMQGKETRFGTSISALWSIATTAASNGSVNSMHDSYMPLGGLAQLVMMQLGEVIFGGVGTGLYGMLVFVIIAVFIAGLMVGRTPEYLGKKIQVYEIKMAALLILIMPLVVLGLSAFAVVTDAGLSARLNPGAHGFSEILYAFTSMGNNNGSAFAGLNANTVFYNTLGGAAMWLARYWLAIPTLALAGSLAKKKRVPESAGTLPTHTPLFIGWLIAVVLLIGALNFLPALALGPVVESLMVK